MCPNNYYEKIPTFLWHRLKDVVIKWTYIGTGMCWKLHRRSHIIGSMLKSIFKSSGQKGGHICHSKEIRVLMSYLLKWYS